MRRWLLLSLFLVSCGGSEQGPLYPHGPEPDPVVVEQPGKEACEPACAKMQELQCEEAAPVELKDGGTMTCAAFCVKQHEDGILWNTDCLKGITACEQIESLCNTQ